MTVARPALPSLALTLAAVALAAGCGGSGGDPSSEAADPASTGPLFAESMAEDRCLVLTADDVAQATGVAPADIETHAVAGICRYTWAGGGVTVMDVDVRETRDEARQIYERYTRDRTAAQIDSALGRLDDGLDEAAAEGDMSESERGVAGSLIDAIEVGDVSHRRLEGIGDGASLSSEGSIRILHGNAVVWIAGDSADGGPIDPALAEAMARRVVANLDALR